MDQRSWLRQNTGSLRGKTVVLTGANGGLGTELCRGILLCGGTLVPVTRNARKAEALTGLLKREFPDAEIHCLWADLTDFSAVEKLAEEVSQLPVDILIHNAGAYSIPRKTCPTGFDNVFQINFLAPYDLTKRLLPLLKERKGKVVAVGSIAHNYAKTDPEDIDFSHRSACSLVYGNSKRYLMFALMRLLRDSGVGFAIGHPGITFTNITAHYPKLIFAIIKHPMKIIFMKPATAARSILLAIFREIPEGCWIGPKVFDVWGNPAVRKLHTCSEDEQARIFRTAEEIDTRLTGEKVQEMSSAEKSCAI